MAAETGFMIDGTLHEVPGLDTLNMDEAQVLYDYSGLSIEDFVEPEDDAEKEEAQAELERKLRNPGFLRALMHIAYQRANPKLSGQRVKQAVGGAQLIGALEHLAADTEGDDAGPPASTTTPEPSSPANSAGSNASSGPASTKSSDRRVVPLATTTTDESPKPSPRSAPTRLGA